MLDLDAQSLKNDRPGQARSTSCRPEADLSAAQILDAFDLGARKDVQLRNGQANDVMNSALEIRSLPFSPEILEDVRLRHGDVDAAQIEKIVEIRSGAVGHDRNDPQIVAVVKHLRQLIGQSHVGARQLAADDADSPTIPSLSQCSVGAALLQRFWHCLHVSRCNKLSHKGSGDKYREYANG